MYTAWRLHKLNKDCALLEARNRTGGRILSPQLSDHADSRIDMGPAWVWPEFQPRLQQLLSTLGLKTFRQYTEGELLYEQDSKTIERYSDQSSHEQSCRIAGGCHKLIDTLQSGLPLSTIKLNSPVQSISMPESGSHIPLTIDVCSDNTTQSYTADQVVLALPPRIALHKINFYPALADDIHQLWLETPTWMATHCKILFIYEQPFWRKQKLSGEVISRHGPLTEIYDGSPQNEDYYALTSFVGLNANQRKQIKQEQLIELSLAQLKRLFGEESQNVRDIKIKDWSTDEYTSTATDLSGIASHPQYPANMPRSLWNNKIILAGTEVAREHGGYIEGALESADDALGYII